MRRLAVVAILLMAACKGRAPGAYDPATGGIPSHGAAAIAQYGCGACHDIPGIHGAHGNVGPPLSDFGKRSFIAGRLANQPANLIAWNSDPPAMDPETAMPKLGLAAQEARDVAAYLYTLE
jgi:cytochrome c2